MQRRRFLSGSVTAATVGLTGCLGGDDEEENCLPEDGREFFEMNGDQIDAWAPQLSGFDLMVQRQPRRPDADVREDRNEDERTYWLDLTYADQDDVVQHGEEEYNLVYQLSISYFQEEEYASDDGAQAEPEQIPHYDQRIAPVDANAVISGSRGRYSYRVLAEGDENEDEAEELFLAIPCVEEEHIQDTTW